VNFNVAAESYDRFMGAWSLPLSLQFADLAGIKPGDRVVDVGCGPGNLTTELVGRLGAESVAAVDPSEPFVVAARARHPGVDVRQASAEMLPFPDRAFDAALAQLVVHFMTDPVGGLREMARVSRTGGTVAACVWDHAGGSGPLSAFWAAAQATDPTVTGEADLAGARQGHLVELFESAGLRNVEGSVLSVSRGFDNFDDWWEPYTHGVGPAGSYLAELPPDRRAELRERCRSGLPDGGFTLTAGAWAARGVVPS
jgi:SAM-dependent methyltransferase